jgi:hypothetical protein
MLPSFRLIAATFLCGFAVIFASLRLAASLNELHETIPVTASRAAPPEMLPPVDADMRRSAAAVPLMYDLRFAVTSASLMPTPASLAIPAVNRTAPTALPPAVVQPPVDLAVLTPAAAETGFAEHDTIVVAVQRMAPDEIPPFERSTTTTQSMTDLPTTNLPTTDLPTEAAASAEPPQLETPVDTADPQVAAAPNAETVGPAIPEPKAGYAPEPEVTAVAASPTMANPVMVASVELRATPAPQPKTESQVVAARPVGPGGPQAAPARIDALAPRSAPAAAMIGPATTKPVQLAAFEPPAAPESGPKPVRLSLDQPAAILVTVPLPRARPALRAKARPAALHIAARPAAASAAAPSLGPKSVAAKPIVKPAGSRAKRTATHTARAVRPDNTTSTGLFPFGDLLPPPPLPNPFGQ